MKHERVTVIVANRNYGRFITGCLESAVREKPSLVVVVDDGSTDDSTSLVLKMMTDSVGALSGEAPYVTGKIGGVRIDMFSSCESRGPSAARNWAIKHSWETTDFFAILDADDQFIPGRIDKCLKSLEKYGEVAGAVYGDYYHVRNGIRSLHCKPSYDRRGLAASNMIHSACVIRKSALQEIGLYDEDLSVAEDYELWMRMAKRRVILHIPEPMMLVNEGAWQMSKSHPAEQWATCVSEAKRRHCQNLLS
jgi:glycosyltransferase involved in cell wall biosynthesis